MSRITGAQRIETWNTAEREIKKYAHDHYLWHKYVHNVELDAVQVLKCEDMDRFPMTLDFSSRRMGKTAVKELYFLKQLATKPDQELGIVAPRQAQAQVNLSYHTDAVRRSDMLSSFINVKQGRQQMADTYLQFANKSKVSAYGIMANVDGGDLTMASLEEVDDMPHDRLFSRFLLMLGSSRRLGASKESSNNPEVRITGVFKGADTLVELIESGEYRVIAAMEGQARTQMINRMIAEGYIPANMINPDQYKLPLPIGNALVGMEMGLLNKNFIESMTGQLGADESARQLFCLNTRSRNLIWEEWVARATQLGVSASLEPVIPVPGKTYKKRGKLALGYDHTGHGEKPESSRSAVVILENLSGFVVPIFAKTWSPGTDESTIKRDMLSVIRYFQPDDLMGDAFGVGLIADVNDLMFKEGLTSVDRNTLGDSTASNWHKWPFAPVQFQGMPKHSMAVSLAGTFSGGRAALPYVSHIEEGHDGYDDVKDLQTLYRQFTNIKAQKTTKQYASYVMVKRDMGDDLFDAAMVGHWALMSGEMDVVTDILLGKATRDNLLS